MDKERTIEAINKLKYRETQELREHYLEIANIFKEKDPEMSKLYEELAVACMVHMKGRMSNLRCRPARYEP